MNQQTISIQELLTQGTLGGVQIGMTREEVKTILGEPSSIGKDEESGFIDYYYGSYEIFFYNFRDDSGLYKVTAFQNDSMNFTNCFTFNNRKIKIHPWFLEHGMSMPEIQACLDQEGLTYQVEKRHKIFFVILESGAEIMFQQDEENEKSDEWLLLGVAYHPSF